MKKCFKCGAQKDVSCFYRHPKMKDGYLNKCKQCVKNDLSNYRQSNDYPRISDRIRSKTVKRREHIASVSRRFRANNPLKYKAQTKVGNYIRDNKLVKEPCKVCGAKFVHAHHEDYSKPLDVIWLCPRHHAMLHNGKIKL